MAAAPGRTLSKPDLVYASNTTVFIDDRASWNLVGVKFAVGARLDNWAVLVIKDGCEFAGTSDPDLHEAVPSFRHVCNVSGIHVTTNPTYATAQLPCKETSDPTRLAAIQTIKDSPDRRHAGQQGQGYL